MNKNRVYYIINSKQKKNGDVMKNTQEILNDINPRDIIIAKVIDDGIKKEKNFLVIGKDDEGLYAIRITPKNQSKNINYRKCNYKLDGIPCYFRWNTIFKLGEKEFIRKRYTLPLEFYDEIIDIVAKKSKTLDYIDFASAKLSLEKSSIILKDENLYIVTNKIKGTNDFKIIKLKEDKGNKNGISIKGSKYITSNEKETINMDDDYVVIGYAPKSAQYYVNNSKFYEFGDVLTLKGKNQKVIYLTEMNDMVYYATFEQLELFTGISKISKNNIGVISRKLDDSELNKIVTRIEKPLSSGNYPLYKEAVESILNTVKQLKK